MTQSDDKKAIFMAKMKALETVFINGLPERMQEISNAVDTCVAQPGEASVVAILHRYLHSIAGTAGTFGYAELGERARELELRLEPALQGGATAIEVIQETLPDFRAYLEWVKTN
jgi:chemotaxis protein histidine kinase CheA